MLNSARLKIIPLLHSQLLAYLHDISILEKELALAHVDIEISVALREAFAASILPNAYDSHPHRLFFTLWVIVDKTLNVITGGVLFTGPPNAAGEVEIGYGINSEFQKRGYASEMVGMMADWALRQDNVKAVTAQTHHDNHASHKTLLKNHFIKTADHAAHGFWKREKLSFI